MVFLLTLVLVFRGFASAMGGQDLELNPLLREAKEKNPEILAARKNWEAAQARILPSKTWMEPEVAAEYMGFPLSGVNAASAVEKRYTVAQKIPFPGKLFWRGKAAGHEARREEGMYLAVQVEVIAGVKEAYYDFLYADRAVKIFRENVELVRGFAKIAESKYSVGKVSQSDALKAQVELSKMLNKLVAFQQEREIAQARLNALLDRRPEMALDAPAEPAFLPVELDVAKLERLALVHRPEMHVAVHHVEHTKAELNAARADYLPDVMVQYGMRAMNGAQPDAVAMLRLSLPMLRFRRQSSIIASVEREREHAQAQLRSVETVTRYEVKKFLVHVQTAQRLVELYRSTVSPQTKQLLRVAQANYQSDKIGFLDLLDSYRTFIDFQLEYYQALADYGKSLAHLERVVGKDLPAE